MFLLKQNTDKGLSAYPKIFGKQWSNIVPEASLPYFETSFRVPKSNGKSLPLPWSLIFQEKTLKLLIENKQFKVLLL